MVDRTTLKDVADHVGVSTKTVSNVVNGTGWVSPELQARVRTALSTLGYRPNAAARQLRSGRSGMIAVAVPDLSQPYFAELASELVRAAQDRSVTVLINQTNGDGDAERRVSNGLGIPVMDGLILSALAVNADDLAHRSDTTPLVLLGEHIGESPFPHVAVDNTVAARTATEHLVARGCRRIAAIGRQISGPNETSTLRLAGYREALDAAGIPFDERLVMTVESFHRGDGAEAALRLLDSGEPLDGIFAFNDLLALGAMHALNERGFHVPGNVAVIGFDDIEEGGYSSPTLTSVSPDKSAIARAALDLVLGQGNPSEKTIPFTITTRASA